jgi:flagellar biosynthesis/type III secretory pathway protein FliH
MNTLDACDNAYHNGYKKGYAAAEEKMNGLLAQLGIENPYSGDKVKTVTELEEILGKIEKKEA